MAVSDLLPGQECPNPQLDLLAPGADTTDPTSNPILAPLGDAPVTTGATPPLLPQPGINAPIDDILPGPLPDQIVAAQPYTPAVDDAAGLPTLDAVVGASLGLPSPNLPDIAPTAMSMKTAALRLPSFASLGIGNPHPDRLHQPSTPALLPPVSDTTAMRVNAMPTPLRLMALSDPAAVTAASAERNPIDEALRPRAAPGRGIKGLDAFTPPEDDSPILWNSLSMDPTKQPHNVFATDGTTETPTITMQGLQTPDSTKQTTANTPRIAIHRTDSDNVRAAWLADVSDMLLTNLRTAESVVSPIKVLSHALPCPSPSGFAFPFVINALQVNTPGSPLCWINVFHALPGRFTMLDIPTSPPGTPDPPVGGQDYFTSKTFDSAVPVLDYQDNLAMPRSPHPIVPPASIALSIVERYIPPTDPIEFADMFKVDGRRSLLVDRLIELSLDNGSLLFIYPTKTGAETFTRQYLGPILDPMLRTMMTVHHIPTDVATSIGSMTAVPSMLEFDQLKSRLEQLCTALSAGHQTLRRFSSRPSKYTLEHARRQDTSLRRDVWADRWWTKQEKTRIKDTITNFAKNGARGAALFTSTTPAGMLHSILDGVVSRPYAPGREPTKGIEVGLFLIRRSPASD